MGRVSDELSPHQEKVHLLSDDLLQKTAYEALKRNNLLFSASPHCYIFVWERSMFSSVVLCREVVTAFQASENVLSVLFLHRFLAPTCILIFAPAISLALATDNTQD